jgi:hypothetical protein
LTDAPVRWTGRCGLAYISGMLDRPSVQRSNKINSLHWQTITHGRVGT